MDRCWPESLDDGTPNVDIHGNVGDEIFLSPMSDWKSALLLPHRVAAVRRQVAAGAGASRRCDFSGCRKVPVGSGRLRWGWISSAFWMTRRYRPRCLFLDGPHCALSFTVARPGRTVVHAMLQGRPTADGLKCSGISSARTPQNCCSFRPNAKDFPDDHAVRCA